MRKQTCFLLLVTCIFFGSSCSMQKQIAKKAAADILNNPDFASAHIGITLYDPAANKYLYDHQGDKFFVPASNTKILTAYAAMKNLGDSLVGLRYIDKGNGTVEAEATADASFLHPDFKNQPVYSLLKSKNKVLLTDHNWKDNALGFGWAWDDYNSDYMAERSMMPVYGNVVKFTQSASVTAMPAYFQKPLDAALVNVKGNFSIRRDMTGNIFTTRAAGSRLTSVDVPMYTRDAGLLTALLNDTLQTTVEQTHIPFDRRVAKTIYSQPTDSLLMIMMHRSDNFFAEQTLLMVSNETLGIMNTARVIDTLLKTDFSGLPQKPRWVDGSGLSRYNLVSPQDFVWVLNQMKNEFSWERIQAIFPTGGEGTLSSYYKNYTGRIYAKTGSLSNHLALSGFITTKKGKQLIFSILVNAEMAPAASIRKGVERFLGGVIEKY